MKSVRYWAVVPAAGAGRRMQADIPKQYLDIQGKPMMVHTLERLLAFPVLEKIVVTVDRDDEFYSNIDVLRNPKIMLAEGGAERYDSVLNGLRVLQDIAAPEDWVMVHDVARPCIRRSDLERLVNQLQDHPVGGLLGVPVTDTIKSADAGGVISHTVERRGLWHAMTPQMFRFAQLHDAMNKAIDDQIPITDEASAMEYAGLQPMMVEAHSDNIKITRGTDLALATLYIEQQSKLVEVS